MHNLTAHTKYKIISLQLAIPAVFSDTFIADYVSHILDNVIESEQSNSDAACEACCVLAAWRHSKNCRPPYPEVWLDARVEEGSAFSRPASFPVPDTDMIDELQDAAHGLAMEIIHGPHSPLDRSMPLPSVADMASCLCKIQDEGLLTIK